MRSLFLIPVLMSAVAGLSCCRSQVGELADIPRIEGREADDTVAVVVEKLVRRDFNSTLVCNGKLEAQYKASIQFSMPGTVSGIFVEEGETVDRGDRLAVIDDRNARYQVQMAEFSYEQSLMTLEDRLTDMELTIADTLYMPSDQKRALYLATGFSQAWLSLCSARQVLEECTLRAPFRGKVADLAGKLYQSSPGEFCKLVDDSHFIVHFQLLESELRDVSKGKKVLVSPYSDLGKSVQGTVTSVNPLISDNGMVSVQALIEGYPGLIDGMNVQVSLLTPYPGSLVVPRSAVKTSNGHTLLFTFSNGRCVWNYVEIVRATDGEYSVEPDLKRNSPLREGDMVIVQGIENLVDGMPVKILE